MRFLIADRKMNGIEWYEMLLQDADHAYESLIVDSQARIIEAIDTFHPQVLLLHDRLPFVRNLVLLKKGFNVPVIILSDNLDTGTALAYMKAGAYDCIWKTEGSRLLQSLAQLMQDTPQPEHMKKPLQRNETGFLASVLQEYPSPAYIKNVAGQYLWLNREQARCLNLADASQAIGMSDADFYPAAAAAVRKEDEERFLQSGHPFEIKEESVIDPLHGVQTAYLTTRGLLPPIKGREKGFYTLLQKVSDLKMSEMQDSTNLERIKLVLESGKVGIFDMDMVQDTIWRTLKHDQIYGYKDLQPDWKLDSFFRFVVPEDLQAVREYMDKAILEGGYHFECRIIRLDGQERWISCQGSAFHDESGKPVRLIGTLMDITANKQDELSLKKRVAELEMVNRISAQMYRGRSIQELLQVLMDETLAAIDLTDGCILLYQPESSILEPVVTRGWYSEMDGYTFNPNECISGYVFKNDQVYITEDIREDARVSQKVKHIIPDKQAGVYMPIHDSEGKLGIIAVSCSLPRTISDDEIRLLTIISRLAGTSATKVRLYEEIHYSYEALQKEVERRKILQNLYAAEREILSTTLMSIAEGVITTDEDGLIILFNHAAEFILGYKSVEVLDKPVNTVLRILDMETDQVVDDAIAALYEMERRQASEELKFRSPTVLTASGEKVLFGGSIASIRSGENQAFGHVIVFQNVTEKQLLEAQNLLSTKMEAIGQLAAGIAHEINTPVQYIGDNLSYLNRVFGKYNDMLAAYQQTLSRLSDQDFFQGEIEHLEYLWRRNRIEHYSREAPLSIQEAMEGVSRVQKIVTAVREFSHPSQKEMQMADINHGIETTVTISRNEWKYYADLETDLDPRLPPVMCQIDEINQVILNMIVNAAQAIHEKLGEAQEEKGKITITTRAAESDHQVIISIQDSGSGIPENIRERIFDPFFTTKGVGKGTGQGLSMAYNIIIKKHGGKILVDSEVNVGTRFTIELPVNNERQ